MGIFSFLNPRIGQAQRAMEPLQRRYDAALRGEPLPGAGMEQEYDKRALSFDPRASLDEYARGAYGRIFEGYGGVKDKLRDLAGRSVGAGRLDTGFFDEDQGEVVGRGMASLSSDISQQAMNATGMQLRNIEDIGQTGEARGTRYLDLLAGGLDRGQAEVNARRQRQAAMWGGILRAGTTIAAAAI